MEQEKDKENLPEQCKLNFVGVKTSYEIIFDNREPKVVLIDILQPVVKVENCTWLEEIKNE